MVTALFSGIGILGFFEFLKSAVFLVGYISSNSLFPEPLTVEEERECLEKMANGDEEAKNILIERNLRLVAHICKKYNSTNVEQDDLISIGTIGLIKGINSFEPSKGVRLATYVARCIDNEILMHLRSTKKIGAEVYLDDPIGKDKDDNTVTLQEVLENNEKSIEDEVDLKFKIKKLYEKIKKPIEELNTIDRQVCKEKVINIGTHNHIGSCIFGNVLNKYYLKYPNVNLNLICEETCEMMRKLQNKELDIVFSKKDSNEVLNGIEYTKLGYLHDVIIASKNSNFANKELTLDDIESQIIYTPRTYSQALKRLEMLSFGKKLNLKNSSYNTILELTSSGKALGLITREYVDENDYKKFNLVEVKTTLELGEIEFGIYTNSNKSTELKDLIKMIKEYFFKLIPKQ